MNYFKKYQKYKNAGLPVMHLGKNGIDYIMYDKVLKKNGKYQDEAFVYDKLSEALENVIDSGFYYPFNTLIYVYDDNGDRHEEVGYSHSHNFESVINEVYYNPHVFSIDEEDIIFYSKQEYAFLMRLKNYLILIDRPDISLNTDIDEVNHLSLNEDASKYKEYRVKTFTNDDLAYYVINKQRKYFITLKREHTDMTLGKRYLVVDNEENYLGIIEVVKKKVVLIDDLTEKDVDYKLEGYKSLNAFKKDLKRSYKEDYNLENNDIEVVINTIKVIRKFK